MSFGHQTKYPYGISSIFYTTTAYVLCMYANIETVQ